MGAVWLAEHVQLGRQAAIKMLLPEFSTNPEVVQRFFNEARAATAIADPGIVQIFDYGHHTDGGAYIVMELLAGEPLDRRLTQLRRLATPDALRIIRQVASTLGAAHATGIIHRDIKPENIFLVRDAEVVGGERAKVLDFGIAKLGSFANGVKTQTSSMMGTPVYMSPEQCRGAGSVDARSDVYALGCVLFQLLTGRPPFVADGVGELIVLHMTEAPPAPSSLRADLPPEIDRLVLRCLAKDPAERFASGTELALAIGALLGSLPSTPRVHAPAPTPVPVSLNQTTLSSSSVSMTAPPRAPRSRLAVILGLSLVVVAGGVITVVAMHGGEDKASSAAAAPPAPAPVPAPTPAPPPPAPAPRPPDPHEQLGATTRVLFTHFAAWAKDHAGAPCPDAAALGDAPDPWGHAYHITCTDQPAGQIVGAISAGPDGIAGNDDDIASWQLSREVTDAVRGSRWVAATVHHTPIKTKAKSPPPAANPTTAPTSAVQVDKDGLPITR